MIDEAKLRALIVDAIREVIGTLVPQREPASGYLSITDAATVAGCSAKTISREINAGRLPAVRRGRLVRVARADLDLWMRNAPAKRGNVVNVAEYARRVRARAEEKK